MRVCPSFPAQTSTALTRELLAEIPSQLLDFMAKRGITPNVPAPVAAVQDPQQYAAASAYPQGQGISNAEEYKNAI